MRDIEVKFLEEYKRTDNLCADIYEGGVSGYISAMDAVPEEERAGIVHWNDDYRALKRLRWLRNRITHDTQGSDCKKADLDMLTAFREHLMKGSDSLGVLTKRRKAKEEAERRAAERKAAERAAAKQAKQKKRAARDEDSIDSSMLKIIVAIAAAAVLITFIVAAIVKNLSH